MTEDPLLSTPFTSLIKGLCIQDNFSEVPGEGDPLGSHCLQPQHVRVWIQVCVRQVCAT